MHASSRIPHLGKGQCCCSNRTLAVLLDPFFSVTLTLHPILQPFLQNTARTQYFSPVPCHCSGQACHLAPGQECHTQWVPGFTLAARAPLNGGHSPITNQIASRPYPKPAEFHITFRTESKVHTRVHKAPSDLSYYHVPKALRSGHTGRLHAPQAGRPLHPCSLGRKTPSRIPHFTSTDVEVFPYPLV